MRTSNKVLLGVNCLLIVLEIIAFIHNCFAFGIGMFRWYTVDSNILQILVSGLVVYYVCQSKELPKYLTILHFITAIGLTVTFIIAAFVLAPSGGYDYYFLNNVAPIQHLIGPILSVVSLLFLEKTSKQPLSIICWPVAYTLVYGLICLFLNILNLMDGPYFFLQAHKTPVGTITLWFGIIAVLCAILGFVYYKVKWRKHG